MKIMKIAFICPRCGTILFDEESNEKACKYCGCKMLSTQYTVEDRVKVRAKEFDNKLYNEYCYSNPLFSSYQFDKRQQQEDKWYAVPQNPNTNRCPKCGNTEFTPVRKKYSLLTGFLTNKVELICNKCGAKIK